MYTKTVPVPLVIRLLACLASLAASAAYASSVPAAPFVYGLQRAEEITTLDYLDASTSVRLVVAAQIMEGLMGFDSNNDKVPVDRLAWKRHCVDRRTYVFRLRGDVTFHPHAHGSEYQDAEPVTADDVEFSLLRAISSESTGRHLLKKIDSVEAITVDLVKIKLSEPDDHLLNSLATNVGFVTCKTYYESLGADDRTRKEAFKKKPIGTGPYQLVESLGANGQPIVLQRFRGFRDQAWATSETGIQTIEFRYYDGTKEIAEGLRAGEIHMASLLLSAFGSGDGLIDLGRGFSPFKVMELWPPYLSILAINLEREHLRTAQVRLLLNSAVDREKIAEACPTFDHQRDEKLPRGYTYYLDITKRYLEEKGDAGFNTIHQRTEVAELVRNLQKASPLILLTARRDDPTRDQILKTVKMGVEERLGIEVNILEIETWEPGQEPEYDLIYVDWTPDSPAEREDLAILYPLFSSQSHANRSHYSEPEVDHLFSQIERVVDEETKEKLYRRIQTKLVEDSPHIWLPSVRGTTMILNDAYQMACGNSIFVYFTSFLKDVGRKLP